MWECRNDARARAASFDSTEIPYTVHERWFAQRLGDAGCVMLIAEAETGEAVGYARFSVQDDEAEISVALAARWRGRGLGGALIDAASRHLLADAGVDRIVALVKPSNAPSLVAFERAGYRRRADTDRAVSLVLDPAAEVEPVPLLFRVEAGPSIGVGHLQRCLSLAAAIAQRGGIPHFLVSGDARAVDWARHATHWSVEPAAASWTARDAAAALHVAAELQAGAIIIDGDGALPEFVDSICAAGRYCCVVDDLAQRRLAAPLVVNGNADAATLPYVPSDPHQRFLLGPRYSILRPEFVRSASVDVEPQVQRVLVTMGGADSFRLGVPVTRRLLAGAQWRVTLVSGPFAAAGRELDQLSSDYPDRLEVLRAPVSIRPALEAADVVVSAAGQTLYELSRLGRPTVAVQVAENQRGQLAAFARSGAVMPAGHAADSDVVDRVADTVSAIAASPERRRQMAAAGRMLVDGRGASRVAAALMAGVDSVRRGESELWQEHP